VGFVGARVLELMINWERFVAAPGTFLFSTGVYLGGLITAVIFAIFWFRHIGVPLLVGLDIIALMVALAMGIGRWGCFASGCCYGTPTDLPWAVTFPELARTIHAGLPEIPLHPSQIYLSLNSLIILGILVLVYRRKRFNGQIMMLYLMLYGGTRFFIEYVRGDRERRFLVEDVLSTSQSLSVLLVIAAAVTYYLLARRHRHSGEPAWQPASTRTPDASAKRAVPARQPKKKARR